MSEDFKQFLESSKILDENNIFLNIIENMKKLCKGVLKENKQLKEDKKKIKKYINSSDFVYDELYKKRETIEKLLGDKENE